MSVSELLASLFSALDVGSLERAHDVTEYLLYVLHKGEKLPADCPLTEKALQTLADLLDGATH